MKIVKSSSSLLRKFLVFNFFAFLILGLFTFFYLKSIQPNLVKQRTEKHTVIIKNTSNHIERLQINFEKKGLKDFLLSTRFLFQNLERVQFYSLDGDLIADTNVLDLDQSVFERTDSITQSQIVNDSLLENSDEINSSIGDIEKKNTIKNLIKNKKDDGPLIF